MKKKNKPIFGKFKLGDKIWYPEFCAPFDHIPGIVMKDRVESVGDKRDEFVKSSICPYVMFEDTDSNLCYRRRKLFPAEKRRLELAKLGLEEEYVKFADTFYWFFDCIKQLFKQSKFTRKYKQVRILY